MRPSSQHLWGPAKRHGGKGRLCKKIIRLFPQHELYVEPFIGWGSVLLNLPRRSRCSEIAYDLDSDLINAWIVIRDYPSPLAKRLAKFTHDEATFEKAKERANTGDALSDAAWFIARCRMSRGGIGEDYGASPRLRGGQPEGQNAWDSLVARLPRLSERIQDTTFRVANVVDEDVLDTINFGVCYLDPPYLPRKRTAPKVYRHEMTEQDHVRLLARCIDMGNRGVAVFISGYQSDLYQDTLEGWIRHDFPCKNNAGQGKVKSKRIECVWESPGRRPGCLF